MRPLSWYMARLRRMSAAEIGYRCRQAARKRMRRAQMRRMAGRPDAPRASALARAVLAEVPRPERVRSIRFFELSFPWPGPEPIDWMRDYRNAVSAPAVFYGDLDYRDAGEVGDVKYTWELNRHQFLASWALEEARTGNGEAARAVARLILEWIAANPLWTGINWTSSLELALRILSWGIALDLCGGLPADPRAREAILVSVAEQADFVRHTLSLYSSANNHLMGELVGLLAAGAFFPEAHRVREHAQFARTLILREAGRQNFSDGVNREGAVYYHHYTLEYLLTAVALFRRLGWEVPAELMELCRRMTTFVDAMTDDRGEPFEIGDRDDGTVTGLNLDSGVDVYESLLWSGWVLFDDVSFRRHAERIARNRGAEPAVDPRTAYWHGEAPAQEPRDGTARQEKEDRRWFFPEGGYAIRKTPDLHVLFKAGPFGYPSIAAHSHCDQLSVCLKYRGQDVLTDSGTYSYHTEERWRRYFKGTTAHNTVCVDGADQAVYAGPFLWATHADGSLLEADGTGELAAGRHNGYRRLARPVDHERRVRTGTEEDGTLLVVEDTLRSAGEHRYELVWNLAPGLTLVPVMEDAEEEAPGADGARTRAVWRLEGLEGVPLPMELVITSPAPFTTTVFRGDEARPAGFYSRRFGERIPIVQLRAAVTAAEWTVTTELRPPPP